MPPGQLMKERPAGQPCYAAFGASWVAQEGKASREALLLIQCILGIAQEGKAIRVARCGWWQSFLGVFRLIDFDLQFFLRLI